MVTCLMPSEMGKKYTNYTFHAPCKWVTIFGHTWCPPKWRLNISEVHTSVFVKVCSLELNFLFWYEYRFSNLSLNMDRYIKVNICFDMEHGIFWGFLGTWEWVEHWYKIALCVLDHVMYNYAFVFSKLWWFEHLLSMYENRLEHHYISILVGKIILLTPWRTNIFQIKSLLEKIWQMKILF